MFGAREVSYILGGIRDWQIRWYSHPLMPGVDVDAEGYCFSFLPSRPKAFMPQRRILEEAFRRRLRLGSDIIPTVPIFLDAHTVLRLQSNDLLASYLDERWQEAVAWALRQLPPLPLGVKESALRPSPGDWESRRLFLEEASRGSLFAVPSRRSHDIIPVEAPAEELNV